MTILLKNSKFPKVYFSVAKILVSQYLARDKRIQFWNSWGFIFVNSSKVLVKIPMDEKLLFFRKFQFSSNWSIGKFTQVEDNFLSTDRPMSVRSESGRRCFRFFTSRKVQFMKKFPGTIILCFNSHTGVFAAGSGFFRKTVFFYFFVQSPKPMEKNICSSIKTTVLWLSLFFCTLRKPFYNPKAPHKTPPRLFFHPCKISFLKIRLVLADIRNIFRKVFFCLDNRLISSKSSSRG